MVEFYANPQVRTDRAWGPPLSNILNREGCRRARREISSWPGYASTPLLSLPDLAAQMGFAAIAYKDESSRFGLGSFKALGGAYAVSRLLAKAVAEHTGQDGVNSAELLSGIYRDIVSTMTVCCATDGNHGRSVAWGSRMFGCRCVIYINETVSPGREAAIAKYGAEVVRTRGSYDDAVRRAAEDGAANGWAVVSDTAYDGYTEIPKDVMQGYTVMSEEAAEQLNAGEPPTHVFVQGGVGGVAAAVCAQLWWHLGGSRPRFIVVEPEQAACLYASARAGRRVSLDGDIESLMAGLACGEPSLLAWDILHLGADFFATIPDAAAEQMMRTLAGGAADDPKIVAGESGVAGIAGLAALAADGEMADRVGLNAGSRVLVFGTEGDTDPVLYEKIVGRSGGQVRAA